jgi:hypothetical protein
MSTVIHETPAASLGESDDWLREMGVRALALDALRDLRGRGDLTAAEAAAARRRLLGTAPRAADRESQAA